MIFHDRGSKHPCAGKANPLPSLGGRNHRGRSIVEGYGALDRRAESTPRSTGMAPMAGGSTSRRTPRPAVFAVPAFLVVVVLAGALTLLPAAAGAGLVIACSAGIAGVMI